MNGCFGSTVHRCGRQRNESQPRRYVDDGALVGREDVYECRTHPHYAGNIDVDLSNQSIEVGCRHLKVLVEHDACVVHQNVDLWIVVPYAPCKSCDLRGICHVALHGVEVRMFRFHLVQHFLTAPSHDDLIAEFGEFEREGKADAGRTTCNKNRAISEFHNNPFVSGFPPIPRFPWYPWDYSRNPIDAKKIRSCAKDDLVRYPRLFSCRQAP